MKERKHKQKKKTIAMLLLTGFAVTSLITPTEATAANIQPSFVVGYEDGTVRPEATATRAETATLVTRLAGALPTGHSMFQDAQGHWAEAQLSYAHEKGFMGGFEDGTLRPNERITRAQCVSMLTRALNITPGGTSSFTDTANHWADEAIAAAVDAKIAGGYPDGTFQPENPVTRAEAIAMLNRGFKRQSVAELVAGQTHLKTFSDLTKDHWAYNDIMSATNDMDLDKVKDDTNTEPTDDPNLPSTPGGGGGSTGGNSQPKERVVYGDANVDGRTFPEVQPFIHPPLYNARVKVELDKNGVIKSVADNGTGTEDSLSPGAKVSTWESKNKPYWDKIAEAKLYDTFIGKSKADIEAMNMNTGEADVVSGATMSGLAVQEAVINAIDGKPGKKFLADGPAMPEKSVTAEAEGTYTAILESKLPADFKASLLDVRHGNKNLAENKVDATFDMPEGAKEATVKLTQAPVKAGKYNVNIVDDNGLYRSPNFEAGHPKPGELSKLQAVYFVVPSTTVKTAEDIVYANGIISVSDEDIANYFNNIEHIIVKDNETGTAIEQEPVGHHGTVNNNFNLFDETGKLNLDAQNRGKNIFEPGKTYTVTISAYGYPEKTIEIAMEGRVAIGDANVDGRTFPEVQPFIHPPLYNARVKVFLDKNDVVTKVIDEGTGTEATLAPGAKVVTWESKNKPYWNKIAEAKLYDKFVGKSKADIEAMHMNTGEADVVSGATMSGLAVQEAVINAIDGKVGKKFLADGPAMPVVSVEKADSGYTATLTNSLPSDFDPQLIDVRHGNKNANEHKVDTATFALADDKATATVALPTAPVKAGKYNVNLSDKNKFYRSPNFEAGHPKPGEPSKLQAVYFVVPSETVTKAEDITLTDGQIVLADNDIANYYNNIEHVIIKDIEAGTEVEQEPVGHHGTVNAGFNVITTDGKLNMEAINRSKPIFEKDKKYDVTIAAYGYPEVTFEVTGGDVTVTPPPAPIEDKAQTGQSAVKNHGYDAKVKVTVGADGVITGVTDNGTDAGISSTFWDNAINGMFAKFVGKTKAEVDAMNKQAGSPDVVSGATFSSAAIIEAVSSSFDDGL